jgi:hypothetical protein
MRLLIHVEFHSPNKTILFIDFKMNLSSELTLISNGLFLLSSDDAKLRSNVS